MSDWTDGWNAKTTARLFYMFFTSIGRHAAVEPRAALDIPPVLVARLINGASERLPSAEGHCGCRYSHTYRTEFC